MNKTADRIFDLPPHAKKSESNPVSALLKLQGQGANLETLCAAMNKTFAVVKYGNEILVASIIGNDISFMDETALP